MLCCLLLVPIFFLFSLVCLPRLSHISRMSRTSVSHVSLMPLSCLAARLFPPLSLRGVDAGLCRKGPYTMVPFVKNRSTIFVGRIRRARTRAVLSGPAGGLNNTLLPHDLRSGPERHSVLAALGPGTHSIVLAMRFVSLGVELCVCWCDSTDL